MRNTAHFAAAVAANRFGLGARPGELAAIGRDAPGWLLEQIAAPAAQGAAIARLDPASEILMEARDVMAARRAERASGDRAKKKKDAAPGGWQRKHYRAALEARYLEATSTDAPLRERLVHFWSNHFAVSADKTPLPAVAGAFENEAIRPRVSGRFEELLLAAVRHPAMLIYLDNLRSFGPNAALTRRANRRRPERRLGLNENLAREVLELHTLGVDGGYTQDDVTELARALTGWSVGGLGRRLRNREPGVFTFFGGAHEPGAREILGVRYAEAGEEQAIAILRDLARHPATARHIARKLATHFVADSPPAVLVERLARTLLEHDGELAPVYAALIDAPEAWRTPLTKFKSPSDFVVSAHRALDVTPRNVRALFVTLESLGQMPWRPGSPAGWPDTAAEWGGADALYKRIEWASAVGARATYTRPERVGDEVLGSTLSADTRTAIRRAQSSAQGLTLLLASPEFQRR